MLLTCALLTCAATAAQATTTDVRGEWAYEVTCTCTFPSTSLHELPGTALIRHLEPNGEFSGTSLLGGILPGTITGAVDGSQLALTMTSRTSPTETVIFTVTAGEVKNEDTEMSGEGTWSYASGPQPNPLPTGTFTAKKTRSYEAILQAEKEAQEKAEQEAKKAQEKELQEKAEREVRQAKEREQKEAQEKAEREVRQAKEREQKEAQEKAERAAREAKEQEEKNKAASNSGTSGLTSALPAMTPARLLTNNVTVSGSGRLVLRLSNANGYVLSGRVVLSAATATSNSKHKATVPLASASFSISADKSASVRLTLSADTRAKLAHGRRLSVVFKIISEANHHAAVVKSYDAVLKLAMGKRS